MALKQAARLARRHGPQAENETGAGCAVRARRAQAALRNGWAPPAGVPYRAGFVVQVPARRAPPGARRALRRGPRGGLGQVLLLRARHGHRLSAAAGSMQRDASTAAQSAVDPAVTQACADALRVCGREAVGASPGVRTCVLLMRLLWMCGMTPPPALVACACSACSGARILAPRRNCVRSCPHAAPVAPSKVANTASGS